MNKENVMIKRQQAFTNKSIKMLKGALHSHTTRSDGVNTPEYSIKYHYDHGYDFMVISDHSKYNMRDDFCPDIPLTIVPGTESGALVRVEQGLRDYDALCLGPIDGLPSPYVQDQPLSSPRVLESLDEYQAYLDEFHSNNMITCICHPMRSFTPPRYLDCLKGLFGIEIYNNGSSIEHDFDSDAQYWDELLDSGMRLYGVATDDDHGDYYSCGGWVMVKSENNAGAILNALKNGEFYSSCGPEIYDFYIDGNKVVVDCSPVDTIYLHCAKHPTDRAFNPGGEITHGVLNIDDSFPYVRISVIDKNGKKAWTNPIFLDQPIR